MKLDSPTAPILAGPAASASSAVRHDELRRENAQLRDALARMDAVFAETQASAARLKGELELIRDQLDATHRELEAYKVSHPVGVVR